MKIGDLVTFKDPCYLVEGDCFDEDRARDLYPWKFEVGIVIDNKPYGLFPGKEVYVSWPSNPLHTVLTKHLEVISESR